MVWGPMGIGKSKWLVEVVTFIGDGHWADYPPYEFATEREAQDFADKQIGEHVKVRLVRRIHATDSTGID